MILLKNINLLISTFRYNETNAKAELWFSLVICGDKYPIISDLEYSGLIAALSNIEAKEVISKFKKITLDDPSFFKNILKVVPIDFVCKSDLAQINQIIKKNYKNYIKEDDSFRISLNRRKNELINRKDLIRIIARNITNPVNLENPDKIIRIEVLGGFCGISFLRKDDIFKPMKKKRKN